MELKRMTIALANGLEATLVATRRDTGGQPMTVYEWEVKRPGAGGTGRKGTQGEVTRAFRAVLATLFALSGRA